MPPQNLADLAVVVPGSESPRKRKGVSWHTTKKKWRATVWDQENKKTLALGLFMKEEDAVNTVRMYKVGGVIPPRKNASNDTPGVSWNKRLQCWQAYARDSARNNIRVNLRIHEEKDDAIRAVQTYKSFGIVPPHQQPIKRSVTERKRVIPGKGVKLVVKTQKYHAYRFRKGKKINLGYHTLEVDALRAIDKFDVHGNVPVKHAPGTSGTGELGGSQHRVMARLPAPPEQRARGGVQQRQHLRVEHVGPCLQQRPQ